MKVNRRRLVFIQFLILIIITISNCEQEKLKESTQNKEEMKKFVVVNSSDQGYVIPHTVKHLEESVPSGGDYTTVVSSQVISQPVMHQQISTRTTYIPSQKLNPPPVCPCAAQVRCKPCNGIVETSLDLYPSSNFNCPCASPISCQKCPPVSLIHEIAARKAQQDQQLAYNLKSHSEKITKYLDLIIKYTDDVVKSEGEAVKAAKEMEEASLKALFARKNMVNISEKARLIAKTSIVENRPCMGMGCPIPSQDMGIYGNDKIFPVEVENIKDYMDNNFATNINGYNGDYNTLDSIENEAGGKINVHKLRFNPNTMRNRGSFQGSGTNEWYRNSNNNFMRNNMNIQNQNNPYYNNGVNMMNTQQRVIQPNNMNNNQMNNLNQNLNVNNNPTNTIPNQTANSQNLRDGQDLKA